MGIKAIASAFILVIIITNQRLTTTLNIKYRKSMKSMFGLLKFNLGTTLGGIYLFLVLAVLILILLDYIDGGLSDGLVIVPAIALTHPWGFMLLQMVGRKSSVEMYLMALFLAGLINTLIIFFTGFIIEKLLSIFWKHKSRNNSSIP